MLAAGARPLEPYPGADAQWRCECLTCGTVGTPRLSGLGRQGPCRPCGRLRANAKTRHDPAVAAQFMLDSGLQPLVPYPGSAARWPCRCLRCGQEILPSYAGIRSGRGCRYCADTDRGAAQLGRPVSARGKTGHDPEAVIEVMRRAGMEPLVEYPGFNAPWRCTCLVCGTVGAPRLHAIQSGQGGCIPCGQAKVAMAARSRRLDPTSTADEMAAAGLDPLVPYPGSDKPWLCLCRGCGREVTPRLTSVRRGRRCRFCATHGLDFTAPTTVYLMSHQRWGALKLGIGACAGYNSRLLQHERTGWVLERSRVFPTGVAARDVEAAVLDRLRADSLVPFLSAATMPNGHSETCDAALTSPSQLWAMVEQEADRTGAATATDGGPRRRPSTAGLVDPLVAAQQMRDAVLDPIGPYPGRANTAWPSRCLTCGTECRPRLNGVRRGGGCPVCRNKAAGEAKITARAALAVNAMRAAGFEPLEAYPGSQPPWRCRCTLCGKESTPSYSNVKQGASRCRHCHTPGWRRRGAGVPAASPSGPRPAEEP
jgi:hypothetical protein